MLPLIILISFKDTSHLKIAPLWRENQHRLKNGPVSMGQYAIFE
jgi:hypothetical protein